MSDQAAGNKEAKALRSRLQWAIISTNLIGMPALLVFIGAILGITFSNAVEDFQRDPLFMPFNFSLLLLVAVLFVVAHFYHVIRTLDPAQKYLAGEGGEKSDFYAPSSQTGRRDLARSALAASEWMPYRTMIWSIIYYIFGAPLAALSVQFAYSFSHSQTFILWVGILATGMLISVFQFYTTRRVLLDFEAGLLEEFPDLLLEKRQSKKSVLEVGLKGKFMGAMVMLAAVLVILTGVASFSSSLRSLQVQLGSFYLERLSEVAPVMDKMVESESEPRNLEVVLYNLFPGRENIFILVDDQHHNLLETPLGPSQKRMVEIIVHGAGWTLERGRPTCHALGEGIYSVVMDHAMYTVARLPLEKANLFVLVPSSRYQKAITGMYFMIITVTIVAVLLALVYAKFSSEEIRNPLVSIMDSIQAMAQGDLTRNVQVTSQDEIGVVARSLAQAIFGLRRLIGRVGEAAAALDNGASSIRSHSSEVSTGSRTQVESVDETYHSTEEMKGSVQGIADSIQTLASSAEQSSASILQVQASIEEVAQNVESLTTSVEETSNSILEMNFSIKEVDDNVQDLTKRAGEAMAAIGEMERLIERVSTGSRETANISEKVTSDAEQGAHAVEMTITGIDKIQKTSQGVAEVITRLGSQAQEIGNILTVIEDVTEETNLLALNAAIIAAQAGEHGRGFSVVADEIKDLAERTASSTQEIADLIQSVQDQAQEAVKRVDEGNRSIADGVKLSEQAGSALHQIQESVRRAMEQTRTIAESATVQAEKSRQVMEFMDGVNSLVVQVAQSTQEQSKSGDLIASAAQRMEEIAHQVKSATTEQTKGSRHVTQSIEHIAEITHYINSAQTDQIKSTETVREVVYRIKEVADNNQRRVQEMSSAVENLAHLAQDLRDILAEFKL